MCRALQSRVLAWTATLWVWILLSSCGGGGGGASTPVPDAGVQACTTDAQKDQLRAYMQTSYFWSGAAPDPDPGSYTGLKDYLSARLFQGDAIVPKDRWSYISDKAAYSLFFEEGKTLGYGIAVNGLESRLPLKVRYVEPDSPAALLGVARGDGLESLNGVSAAQLVAAGNYSALNPSKEGDVLVVQTTNSVGARTVNIVAATYGLTPVPVSRLLTLHNGSKAGYVVLKDFISQSEAPLANVFADFRTAGATDIILDLRYNGGGLISIANVLASLVAGSAHNGELFTQLKFNAQQSSRNSSYFLAATATGFQRAIVLAGPRTCSASELLANGLKPYLQVVMLGGQTCGKPFGFSPVDICESTISAVNFEAVNALGQGRYYNGIAPTCAVQEDFSGALGDASEKLTAAALGYLETGSCPVAAASLAARMQSTAPRGTVVVIEPEFNRGML
jgi:C-terminal processing protease CtpA/Prc